MYLGDKVALEELRNNSICILTPFGIRNINDDIDIMSECTVYVQNIISYKGEEYRGDFYINRGEMVRYKKVNICM